MEQNWSRNTTFGAARVHRPSSVAEVQRIVAGASKARVVGTGHSFNDVVSTSGDLISLELMDRVLSIDPIEQTATTGGGTSFRRLCEALDEQGLALQNLPSVPHFNIAGACATGTHGSGDSNAAMAARLSSVELVTAGGDLVTIDRQTAGDHLGAVGVGLGAFGVITAATLDVEPSFQMAQEVHAELPLDDAIDQFDEIMASAYSVSWFLTWRRPVVDFLWRKHRLADDGSDPITSESLFGGRRSSPARGPQGLENAEFFTDQALTPLPWHHVLSHLHPRNDVVGGTELQSEYFVPRRHAADALRALATFAPAFAPMILTSEIRTVAEDTLWISPFDEPTVALHFSWETKKLAAVEAMLPELEAALEPFECRPHWAKLFAYRGNDLRNRFPRFDEWAALVGTYDPDGCFRNGFLDRLLS